MLYGRPRYHLQNVSSSQTVSLSPQDTPALNPPEPLFPHPALCFKDLCRVGFCRSWPPVLTFNITSNLW